MRILHIAAHVGGGIGSSYIGLGTGSEEHRIILLERPIDKVSLSMVEEAGFVVLIEPGKEQICQELEESDVVVFNWSHHPVMTRFLVEFPSVPIRSVLWCHISGNYFPVIQPDFLRLFDQVMFATPFSLELPLIRSMGEDYVKDHFQVVYGLNDLTRFGEVIQKKHKGFCIGYVGTLGFCKLNPDFLHFCNAVNIEGVQYVIAGDLPEKDNIKKLVEQIDNGINYCFPGRVRDVPSALSEMDVFGYLLNSQHFGATENALLEAMAAGLPVIALDQCVERYIIKDKRTGLLVHTPEEYGQAVHFLYDNPDKAYDMGQRARIDILERFDIGKNRRRFANTCERAFLAEKKCMNLTSFFRGDPADWFLSCVGIERTSFEKNRLEGVGHIFHEHTKGSPIHYHTVFPHDRRLELWSELLVQR